MQTFLKLIGVTIVFLPFSGYSNEDNLEVKDGGGKGLYKVSGAGISEEQVINDGGETSKYFTVNEYEILTVKHTCDILFSSDKVNTRQFTVVPYYKPRRSNIYDHRYTPSDSVNGYYALPPYNEDGDYQITVKDGVCASLISHDAYKFSIDIKTSPNPTVVVGINQGQLPIPGGGGATQQCLNINGDNGVIAENRDVYVKWQDDGNLVMYIQNTGTPIWSSGTVGNATDLCFQGDGNLVIYNNGAPTWATGTNPAGEILALQTDCNLVIYDGGGAPLWNSRTSCPN